jgi:hypothetical protein
MVLASMQVISSVLLVIKCLYYCVVLLLQPFMVFFFDFIITSGFSGKLGTILIGIIQV